MPTKIPVTFELTSTHELILAALLLLEPERFDDLVAAVRLLSGTEFRYIDLLRITVRGAIDKDSLFWLLKNNHPGAISRQEIEREFQFLERLRLVAKDTMQPASGEADKGGSSRLSTLSLTEVGADAAKRALEGRKAILRPPWAERKTVFVASAVQFKDIDDLYQKELEPLCVELGYSPLRVDRAEHDQSITAAILEGIREAACVIADLTYARPSVYFEVGLAHGLGVPLVLTCRQDHERGTEKDKKVHFDLEHYKISYWSTGKGGSFLWGVEHNHPKKRLQAVLGPLGREGEAGIFG